MSEQQGAVYDSLGVGELARALSFWPDTRECGVRTVLASPVLRI